ncbi:MAG: hypothetical protein ACTHK1_08335 [Actinomycetales bacterium]
MLTTVVLTEDALTPHDVDRLTALHDEPLQVVLLVPAKRSEGFVETVDRVLLGSIHNASTEPHDERGDEVGPEPSLRRSKVALETAGIGIAEARLSDDPVADVVAAATGRDALDVVVITPPHLVEEGLHRDWASRIRRETDRPVLHVVAGTDRVVS